MARVRAVSDELGDAHAPPGSRSWAIHVKDEIYRHLQDGQAEVKGAQAYLRAIRESGGWCHLRGEDGAKFPSFEAFCRDRYPFGAGLDPELAVSIIEADPNEILGQVRAKASERAQAAAQKTTGEVRGRGGDHRAIDDSSIATQAERAKRNGVSIDTQKRLDVVARRRPDLLEEVRSGRMKTSAAYNEAMGIQPPTPFEQAEKAVEKLKKGEPFRLAAQVLLPKLTPTEKRKLKELLE